MWFFFGNNIYSGKKGSDKRTFTHLIELYQLKPKVFRIFKMLPHRQITFAAPNGSNYGFTMHPLAQQMEFLPKDVTISM